MKLFCEIFFLLLLITVIHEAGHIATMKLFGVRIRKIQIAFINLVEFDFNTFRLAFGFLPLGGYTLPSQNDWIPLESWKKRIILFAGIFMNLMFALVAYQFDGAFWHDAMIINLFKAGFNLFPMPGSDGFKIIMLNFKRRNGNQR